MSMEEKFNEIIREQLPEKVGEELRGVLEDYQKVKKELESKETALKNSKEYTSKLETENQKIGANLSKASAELKAFQDREKDLIDREIKIEVAMLKTQLAASQGVEASLNNFMHNISKSPNYRRTVTENKDIHVPAMVDSSGCQVQYETTKNLMRTVTESIDED